MIQQRYFCSTVIYYVCGICKAINNKSKKTIALPKRKTIVHKNEKTFWLNFNYDFFFIFFYFISNITIS